MLKCIRLTLVRCYTIRLDDENEEDLKMIDLDGEEFKNALINRIVENGDVSILDEDDELDIEPQDISIIETYYV